MKLNKVYLEDLSLPCCGRLWLSHLWWSSGNLDFSLIEYTFLVTLVMNSCRMTLDSASSCLSLTRILFGLYLSFLAELSCILW